MREENLGAGSVASLEDGFCSPLRLSPRRRWADVADRQERTFLKSGVLRAGRPVPSLSFCSVVWQPPCESEVAVRRVRMSKRLLTAPSLPSAPELCVSVSPPSSHHREVLTLGSQGAEAAGRAVTSGTR